MNRSLLMDAFTLMSALILGASAESAVVAQEVTPASPQFKSYAGEQSIGPSVPGLAKELSEQAKVISDLEARLTKAEKIIGSLVNYLEKEQVVLQKLIEERKK